MLNSTLPDRRWGARVATDNPSTSYRHGIPHPCRALDLSCSGALLLYGGFQVLRDQLTLGDLMMFLVYLLGLAAIWATSRP